MWNEYGQKAKEASKALAKAGNQLRVNAVCLIADRLECNSANLMVANSYDLQTARRNGMSEAMLDRLRVTSERITQMASGLRVLAEQQDPLGRSLEQMERPNGLHIEKISVPLGVIALIYEARPNVTADAAGLCLRAGNAVILRGGKEAINTNRLIAGLMRGALAELNLPEDAVQLMEDEGREGAQSLMTMNAYVDLLIPRGSKALIDSVVQHATVPVLKTGEGVCHTYVDKDADIGMAASIVHNAKVSRCTVCNALECLLVHKDIAEAALPVISGKLFESGVTILGDEETLRIVPQAQPATENDWGHEFLSLTLACRVVDSMEDAMEHISRYGSGHSEAIVTENLETAEHFLNAVDAAAVYHNASTRFTDGGEFGMGAEIGISTQKLHARGPAGLNALTSYKYIIKGGGQIR